LLNSEGEGSGLRVLFFDIVYLQR